MNRNRQEPLGQLLRLREAPAVERDANLGDGADRRRIHPAESQTPSRRRGTEPISILTRSADQRESDARGCLGRGRRRCRSSKCCHTLGAAFIRPQQTPAPMPKQACLRAGKPPQRERRRVCRLAEPEQRQRRRQPIERRMQEDRHSPRRNEAAQRSREAGACPCAVFAVQLRSDLSGIGGDGASGAAGHTLAATKAEQADVALRPERTLTGRDAQGLRRIVHDEGLSRATERPGAADIRRESEQVSRDDAERRGLADQPLEGSVVKVERLRIDVAGCCLEPRSVNGCRNRKTGVGRHDHATTGGEPMQGPKDHRQPGAAARRQEHVADAEGIPQPGLEVRDGGLRPHDTADAGPEVHERQRSAGRGEMTQRHGRFFTI
jgi:hypothetical protein